MPFKKGESGNPASRPRGIEDRRGALRKLLEPHAPELVNKAVELAKDGDVAALRLVLDKLIPPAKSEPVDVPQLAGSLADAGRAVLAAVGEGRLVPDEALALMQAVTAQSRIVEVAEIEKRIAALEEAAKRKGNA
jgi:hypothetical protein